MTKIQIRKIEIRNFKATASQIIDLAPSGIIIAGHNGSGKSSIIQSVLWVLGMSMPAEQILNSSTTAPASVEMVLSVDGEDIKLSRVLVPQKNEAGKVVASTSNYAINGQPEKATLYASKVAEIFGTKDWQYLLNPSLGPSLRDARNILLAVASVPSESEFMTQHNPALAQTIGNTAFSDFEAREKQVVQALGKKILEIPGRIEENAAMLQPVEEIDLTGIEERIKAINAEFKGVDQANATRADEYNKVLNEAREMQYQAAKLRAQAAEKVAKANKAANKQVEAAEQLVYDWNRTRADLSRQMDQIKAEMSEARQDQARKEKQLAEVNADIQVIANQCREISARVPSADGQCSACGVYCDQLQAKGIEAAIAANAQELDNTKQKGRATVAQRDKLQGDLGAIAKKIDGLMSKEHEIEAKINALSPEPKAPERKVVESTEESRHLEQQAADLEANAENIIKSNKLEVAQRPAELMQDLQQLNEKLTRGTAIAQTQKNNDKINARIAELREEERQLIITQLEHKQHIAQLKEFYKQYAESVTASANKLFDDTDFEIRLFETNMGNDRGVIVMQPMKEGNTNLSSAESLIFGKLFIERVLSAHYGVVAPILTDNAEGIDSTEKLRSEHQVIAARVERHELTIENI